MKHNYPDPGLYAGKQLQLLMRKNHRTQEDFAENLNVDVRTVRRWIHEGISDIHRIFEIADFFGIDAQQMLPFTR